VLNHTHFKDYQREAEDFFWCVRRGLAFIEMGHGKTGVFLRLLTRLRQEKRYLRALIVAPINVAHGVWPLEIEKWDFSQDVDYRVLHIHARDAVPSAFAKWLLKDPWVREDEGSGSVAKVIARVKEAMRTQAARSDSWLHIINEDGLDELVSRYIEPYLSGGRIKYRQVAPWPYDVVICDDCGIAAPSSVRFQALKRISQKTPVAFWILTGSVAADNFLHLFPMTFLVDAGVRFGRSFGAFKDAFFDEYNGAFRSTKGSRRRMQEKIGDISISIRGRLSVQKPNFIERPLSFTDAQYEAYTTLERDLFLNLPSGDRIDVAAARAVGTKLQQMTSGGLYVYEDNPGRAARKRRVVPFGRAKIDDLKALRAEVKTPILVVYWFSSAIDGIKKAFSDFEEFHPALEGRWNDSKIALMGLHPASAAHGLNLQYGECRDMYIYDIPWSNDKFRQIVARLVRMGQRYGVRVHVPRIVGTIDDIIWKDKSRKSNQQGEFLALYDWLQSAKERYDSAS
jgi:hypothetical protein